MCDDVAKLACHGQGHCHTVSSTMAAFLNPFCQVPRLFLCFGLACLRLGVWTGRDFDRNEKKLYGGIHRSRKTIVVNVRSEYFLIIFWMLAGLPGLTTMPKIRIFQQTYPFSERGLFGRQQTCVVDHVDPHTHHPVFCS